MRKSGIELLRILSLFGVIMIHYWEQACLYAEGINFHTLVFLRSLSASAVDVFILISGYFLCTTDKRTLGKPINLIVQVSLINELAYLIKSHYGIEPPINLRHITSTFLPDSYYTTLFVVLYLMSPYLNKAISQLTEKGWKRLMILMIIIFSLYQTAYDFFSEVIGKEIMGLSTIGAWGGQQGFNIVNFSLLYIIGAYLRYNSIIMSMRKKAFLLALCVITLFVWAEIDLFIGSSLFYSAWLYHNPIVILLGVVAFLLFKDINFSSKVVNMAAKSVYTCFLAHCTIIGILNIDVYSRMPLHIMLLHYVTISVVCYIVCWLIWYVYDKICSTIYMRLDRIQLHYFE